MYNEGFQPWYRDRMRFNLRATNTRQYFATEEGLAAINTLLNAKFKYLWTPAILYCKYDSRARGRGYFFPVENCMQNRKLQSMNS